MKKIIFALTLILSSVSAPGQTRGWFVPGAAPTAQHLNDIVAFNANSAVAVGDGGTILKTSDGGQSWINVVSGTTSNLSALFFIDSQTGWAVGFDRTILKTTDGGVTWSPQSFTLANRSSFDVFFVDANTGWISCRDDFPGYRALIYKSTNGGSGWSSTMMATSSNLYSLWFTDASTGYAVGAGGQIFKTTNGGTAWTALSSGTANALKSVKFVNAQTGFAAGSNGTILKTSNSGETWLPLNSGVATHFYTVDFATESKGWVVGENGVVLFTEDGGTTWKPQTSGTSNTIRSVDFVDSNIGWAVGANGLVLKTTSGGKVDKDIALTALDVPAVVAKGQAFAVKATVKNNSTEPQSGFPIRYQFNGGAIVNETFSAALAGNASVTFTFATPVVPDALGDQQLTVWTQLPGDENNQNDSLSASIYVYEEAPPPPDPAGWFSQNDPSIANINWNDVYYLDLQNAIAVGTQGTIFRTSNGQTWEKIASGTTNELLAIHFIDSQTGWIAGAYGALFKTQDGGWSWTALNPGTTATLKSIHFVDANTGWITTSDRTVLKTTNGGGSWSVVYTGSSLSYYEDIHFLDANKGFMVGMSSGSQLRQMFRSDDGGASWSPIDLNALGWLKAVHFSDALHGWAAGITASSMSYDDFFGWTISGKKAVVWQTDDGGQTWLGTQFELALWLYDVYGTDPTTFWGVGEKGTILKTADKGKTWSVQNSQTESTLLGAKFVDAYNGLIVGQKGAILKTITSGLKWEAQLASVTSAFLSSAYFNDSQTGWVVGMNGTIIKTENGGRQWVVQASGNTSGLEAVQFVNANAGWIAGRGGVILKTDNAGQTWSPQSSGTSNDLSDLFFLDAQTGWAVGSNGTLLKTTNGGVGWASQTTGLSERLVAIHFSDTQHGWIATENGKILRTTNGGQTWETRVVAPNTYLYDFCLVDANIGWVAGAKGVIFRTADGGLNWMQQSTPVDATLFSIHFTDSNTGWAVGAQSTILTTRDGGLTWGIQQTSSPGWFTFDDVFFASNETGWIVGSNGLILKTSDGGGAISYPPGVPVLLAPLNATKDLGGTVLLQWQPVNNAQSYHLQVATNAQFTNPIVEESSVPGTSFELRGLASNTMFYWHVRAINSDGVSGWSERRTFSTTAPPQQEPTLRSPSNYATSVPFEPILEWSSVFGATQYLLQIALDADFTKMVFSYDNLTATSRQVGPLQSGTTYFWRVCGKNNAGSGPFSLTKQFTTKSYPVPVLRRPKMDEQKVGSSAPFEWFAVSEAIDYRLQIARDSSFQNIVYDIPHLTGSNYIQKGLKPNTAYYWRMSATTSQGEGPFSAIWHFRTAVWLSQASNVNDALYSIFFVDDSTGWAVGWDGTILKTADRGVSWNRQTSNVTAHLRSVFFTDPMHGWAVGWRGTVVKTEDAGATWTPVTGLGTRWFEKVIFLNPQIGWIIGGGALLRTQDGGATWETMPPQIYAKGAHFIDARLGWMVGTAGEISQTNDGGLNWVGRSSHVTTTLNAVFFVDSKVGFIVGDQGVLLKTENGGESWSAIPSGTNENLNDVRFTDLLNGWAFGDGTTLLHTRNGGLTWENLTCDVSYLIANSSFFQDQGGTIQGWVVGYGGTIMTTSIEQNVSLAFPQPLTPAHLAGDVGTAPTLSWRAVADSARYRLQVSASPYFQSFIINQTGLKDTSWTASDLRYETDYYWRVQASEGDQAGLWSPVFRFKTQSATLVPLSDESLPTDFYLAQNYPNPFNPGTVIRFGLPGRERVTLTIYDALGREIAVLLDEMREAGHYIVEWRPATASGLYFYRIRIGHWSETRKMLYLR